MYCNKNTIAIIFDFRLNSEDYFPSMQRMPILRPHLATELFCDATQYLCVDVVENARVALLRQKRRRKDTKRENTTRVAKVPKPWSHLLHRPCPGISTPIKHCVIVTWKSEPDASASTHFTNKWWLDFFPKESTWQTDELNTHHTYIIYAHTYVCILYIRWEFIEPPKIF